MTVVDSQSWTGREHFSPTPAGYVLRWINRLLYPSYDCEDCIGMMISHGCYCAAYDAVAPCTPPEPWRAWARSLIGKSK